MIYIFFSFVIEDLYPFVIPKSAIKLEFLFACLNSFCIIIIFLENNDGVKVKSLLSDIA